MQFEANGDGGGAVATADALRQIEEGGTQEVIEMLQSAPPGPVTTEWGVGYRGYNECWEAIQKENLPLKEGEIRVPMRYTVNEAPSYEVVTSNALWKDPSKAKEQEMLRQNSRNNGRVALYFPETLRDARRMEQYRPGLDPYSHECQDTLGVSLAKLESKCKVSHRNTARVVPQRSQPTQHALQTRTSTTTRKSSVSTTLSSRSFSWSSTRMPPMCSCTT